MFEGRERLGHERGGVAGSAAVGFCAIWQAVLDDFHARHGLAGVRVSINDMGATPAVVSLRLEQAMAELANGAQP